MEYLLNSYVEKVKRFKQFPFEGTRVTREHIRLSEVRVGVPKETTLEQWLVMQRSAIKAEQQGIKITFGVGE
jgi:hypothetical protein